MIPLFRVRKVSYQYLIGSYIDDDQSDDHDDILDGQTIDHYIIDDICHHPHQRSDTEVEKLTIGEI